MDAKEVIDSYQQGKRDFQGVNLKGQSFEKQNLQGIDFSGAYLQGAKFSEAQLQGAKFIGANLEKAKFTSSDISATDFANAILIKADFSKTKADAHNINFNNANLQEAKFIGANLKGAEFIDSDIRGTNFTDSTLIKADFSKSKAGLINHKILPYLLNHLIFELLPIFFWIFIITVLLITWLFYLFFYSALQQEPEQLQLGIAIFFIFVIGFFSYIIVNYRQGTKASLIITASSALAILLIQFEQPVILFVVLVLVLSKLFIFCINVTAILSQLIPRLYIVNTEDFFGVSFLVIFMLMSVLISFPNIQPESLFSLCIPLLCIYYLLFFLKVPHWILAVVLEMILIILGMIYYNYIVGQQNLIHLSLLPVSLMVIMSAILLNIAVAVLTYRYCILGWQKIYAIIFTLFWPILFFTSVILLLFVWFESNISNRNIWLYIIGFLVIYFLALVQGVHAGLCTLEVDKRYILIRNLGYSYLNTGKVTSFQRADLTEANFTEAELKNTDFRRANLKQVDWTKAKNLHLAHMGSSYLQSRQIRNLLVDRKAKDKNA